MAKEIERKFLVKEVNAIKDILTSQHIVPVSIKQIYICAKPEIRIRCEDDTICTLTIKEKTKNPLVRDEVEYKISIKEFANLSKSSIGSIRKFRYKLQVDDGLFWEVDRFYDFADLWLAEIELPSEDYNLELLPWVGEEVTNNKEYKNFFMATHKRCQHYDYSGRMLCTNWAEFTICDPLDGFVCNEHKCRCSKRFV